MHGPLGGERLDVLATLIAAATYNAQRTKKTDPFVRPADLLPQWDRGARKPEQPWQEQLAAAKAWTRRFGGTVSDD